MLTAHCRCKLDKSLCAFSDGLGNGGKCGEVTERSRGFGFGVVGAVRGAGTGDFDWSGGGGADFRREMVLVSGLDREPGVLCGLGGGGAGASLFLGDGDGLVTIDCVGDLRTGGGGLPGRIFPLDFPASLLLLISSSSSSSLPNGLRLILGAGTTFLGLLTLELNEEPTETSVG